ncbi:type 1 glutamine amidotransferase [Desulfomonile tiedjei]|uniref:GMP synthase family protein n=1 Tax=Desulfomonile tiedjei (strain ATCC 49306 / DSM 6799 / DCB-1) TaxID=706587 RepID=I4CCC2_DESTA|nr:gamma-glutamyl-gamma-aminobutyrate hydrolase family protein [Desulfomonile tiedjei]AFM27213.1 GMP synthase family protein [Desulfomonile tiedjei DSM 6799]
MKSSLRPMVRIVLPLCIALVALFWMCRESAAEDRSKNENRRPWLMVGLSTDGCSRGCKHVFSVIKQLSGNPNGVILHFSKVTLETVMEMQPEFIVLSPQGTPWCRYSGELGVSLQNFLWSLPVFAEDMNIPMLGICGGHQALALAFGGKVGPVRSVDDDCMPYSRDRQGGVVPLTVTSQDPIFEGVAGSIRMLESHFDEVKVLPPGFVLLASEKVSRNQIIRHPSKPVYGIQGHPEHFYSNRPDGGILLKNFLRIASAHNKAVKRFPEPQQLISSSTGEHGQSVR